MHSIVQLLSALVLLSFSLTLFASDQNNDRGLKNDVKSDIYQLRQDVKTISSDIEIVRRDEINYKIEKDLLKEAYSSNLQSVNIVITIVFGVFGLLGYLGMKSIKEIRSDYATELEELRKIKTNFERELKDLVNQQKEFENKIGNLTKVNEEQDRRLKVLELIEKISELIQSKQYTWAKQFIDVGLTLDTESTILWTQKSICHGRLGEIQQSIEACKEVIRIEPTNLLIVGNLLEMLTLTKQSKEFEKLYAVHKDEFENLFDGVFVFYLHTLGALINGDVDAAKKALDGFAKQHLGEPKKYLGPTWQFDEASFEILKLPAGAQKDLLFKEGLNKQQQMRTMRSRSAVEIRIGRK